MSDIRYGTMFVARDGIEYYALSAPEKGIILAEDPSGNEQCVTYSDALIITSQEYPAEV